MDSLDMPSSVLDLNEDTIDRNVIESVPGSYALGSYENNSFYPLYVGRADFDLNSRLKQLVNGRFTHFKFSYARSPRIAFEKECRIYHACGGAEGPLLNEAHPQPFEGMLWKCPCCSIFG